MNFASFAYSSAMPGFAPLQSLFRVFFAPPAVGLPQPQGQRLNGRIASQPAFLRHVAQKYNIGRDIGSEVGREVRMESMAQPVGSMAAVRVQAMPTVSAPRIRKGLPALRVMRMLESGQSPKAVGRMVISGRMADVCAELDRLVIREQRSGEAVLH